MTINTNCLIMTPELENLSKQFPKMRSKIFRDLVRKWQDEYNKKGEIPTKDDLIKIATKIWDNWTDYINPDDVKVTNIYAGANQNTILSNFAERPFFFQSSISGDTYFPKYDVTKYRLIAQEDTPKDERNKYDLSFRVYEKSN